MNFRPVDKAGKRGEEINLTPLVDVVLQLVLFFMVTTQFTVLPALTYTLPEISKTNQAKVSERLDIMVSAQDDIFFEGQPTNLAQLPQLLDSTGADPKNMVILISADQNARHGQIMKLVDVLKNKGFKRMVMAAKNESLNGSENLANESK